MSAMPLILWEKSLAMVRDALPTWGKRQVMCTGRVVSNPETIQNGLVADDSSAQPLNRTDRGVWTRRSRLLAAVPRFLMVANTTAVRSLRVRLGVPSDWCGRIDYDVRMAPSGRKNR
jgi:hypothetical protein